MDDFRYQNGRLHCEDIPVSQIAEQFGTPTYLYSQKTFLDHFDRLKTAFSDGGQIDPLICYSVKSSGNIHLCRMLAERGAGMDVVSGWELERAFLAGCPMDRIVYAGVGKTDAEIMAALDGRYSLLGDMGGRGIPDPTGRGPIGYFNIESEPEFENIAAIARRLGVHTRGALRVNPDVDPKTHVYTSTGKKESKFGVDIERALAFFERYGRDEFLKLDAIHLHIGSPIYSTEPYIAAIEKTLDLIDTLESRGYKINALDLGGGFGADYETDKSPVAADYAAAIMPLLRERLNNGMRLILEPGRTISANAGLLLLRVLYIKQGGNKQFVICDGGMNNLLRPALYSAFHFIWPAEVEPQFIPPRRAEHIELPGLETCDIVGPICESGDFLAKERKLPPMKRGDLVAVYTAGAYGMVMASNYNAQPMPAEVLVSGSDAQLIRRRQNTHDLVGPELLD